MDKLPNFENAVIAIEKLEKYVLNADHPDGQHKARVFKACLGIGRDHAAAFAKIIENGLEKAPAQFSETTQYGDHWTTWHEVIGMQRQSVIVTIGWVFKKSTPSVPSMTTCYIETGEQDRLKKLVASRLVGP
jgi:hypothetical protein